MGIIISDLQSKIQIKSNLYKFQNEKFLSMYRSNLQNNYISFVKLKKKKGNDYNSVRENKAQTWSLINLAVIATSIRLLLREKILC